jgi:hypothetical protein
VFSEVTAGVFALVGVVLGGLITSAWSYLGERRRSRTALYVSAFSCLTRWQKVEDARRTKQDSLANEVTHLGRDLDAYMVAIPQLFGRRERIRHREIHGSMVALFGERDLTKALTEEDDRRITEAIASLAGAIQQEFERESLPARVFGRAKRRLSR